MKYDRVYNFSAGPATMPVEVLEEIRDEMLNYKGSGMCVMEMSHRSKVYQQIIDEAEADLRTLMNIPDNYKVLFIQGGATLQFAAIPLNLCKNGVFDYIVTGNPPDRWRPRGETGPNGTAGGRGVCPRWSRRSYW